MAFQDIARAMSAVLSEYLGLEQFGMGIIKRGHGGRPGSRILVEQTLGVEEWLEHGIWAVALSTNVMMIRYDSKRRLLYVAFASKDFRKPRLYKYFGVESFRAEEMFLAPSMGQFVHQKLKGYSFQGPLTPGNV